MYKNTHQWTDQSAAVFACAKRTKGHRFFNALVEKRYIWGQCKNSTSKIRIKNAIQI